MKKSVVATSALLSASLVVAGESIRCGTNLIQEGDPVMDLLEHCGEPTQRIGNKWIYDFGDHAFMTVITLRGNDLDIDRIEQEPRD